MDNTDISKNNESKFYINEFYFYRGMVLNIVNNYRNLTSGNLTSFLDDNEFLDLSLAVTYMTLSKDLVIKKDVANNDPEKRLESSVDMEDFDKLLNKEYNKFAPTVHKSTGTSSRWIIDSIRDSILHGQFTVNYNKKCYEINNKMKNRELICDVPFSWFKSYVDFHIPEQKKLKEINITDAFFNQDTFDNFNLIHNEQELKDFTNDIITYNINIKSDIEINEKKIRREIKNYIDEKNYLNVDEEFKDKSYRQKWDIIKKDLTQYLKNNYPNINVSINEQKDEFISKNLISLYNEENNNIFAEKDKRIQYSEIKTRINKYLSISDEDVLNSIEKFISSRKIYNEEIKNSKDYEECKDVIFYILNSKNNGSKTLEFIHKHRIKKGLENTYDDKILGDLHVITIDDEDKYGISKFLENKYGFAPSSIQIKLSVLKEYNIDIYNKYNKRFEINDTISKEDIEFYNKKVIRTAEQLRSSIDKEKDLLEVGMIYNLGINAYVVNKEKVFDEYGYNDIDIKNIKAYSSSAYKDLDINFDAQKDRIDNKSKKLQDIIDKNPDPSKRVTKLINKTQYEIQVSKNILKEMESKKAKSIVYNKVPYLPVDNDNAARITRNCLSHFNRINFTSYSDGELLLKDETGIVKCSTDDLLKFIVNDTFHNEMRDAYDGLANVSPEITLHIQNLLSLPGQNNLPINIYEDKKQQEKSGKRI